MACKVNGSRKTILEFPLDNRNQINILDTMIKAVTVPVTTTTTKYQTSNGNQYDTKEEAMQAEAIDQTAEMIRAALEKHSVWSHVSTSVHDIARALVNNNKSDNAHVVVVSAIG